ncbi:hypothetical protein [Luteolibacter sp. AS25]|uniref:hypothetical protein n=1 Tax=Luteolibacter sp. AS25 TaxID=3135776 RepID=UPI00398BB89D
MIIVSLFKTHLSAKFSLPEKGRAAVSSISRKLGFHGKERNYPHGYSYGITPRPARALMHDPLSAIHSHGYSSRGFSSLPEA